MGKAILKLIKSLRDIERFGKKSIEIAREHDFNKIIVKVEELYRKYAN